MEVDVRSDEAVYEQHVAEMVRFATGLVGRDDAADVTTEAFLRVSSSPVWADARDRRALWFRAIVFEARSLARESSRRRHRELRANSGRVNSEDAPPDDRIETALEELSTQQRAVVLLTYWLDLDPAQVAELLDVSDGTVRKQLARARKKLKEALS